jgi:hypothetical protein
MEGLGRAKQDARAEGNAGAIAEVHRVAQGGAGAMRHRDVRLHGEGETTKRSRGWPGPGAGAMCANRNPECFQRFSQTSNRLLTGILWSALSFMP